jgi:hypothetical protein
MRKFVFIILIILFSSIYYYSTVENENSLSFAIKNKVGSVVQSLRPSANEEQNKLLKKESLPESKEDFGTDLGALPGRELSEWITKESASMDMTNNETGQIEIRLKASAKTLKPEQLKVLSDLVLNQKLPANERIFSAYLLTLNTSSASTAVQYDLAKEALPNLGEPTPHSEAELKRAQELALRYMQVDDLAEKAKMDSLAREKLKSLASEASSDEVKRYVLRKLKDLGL